MVASPLWRAIKRSALVTGTIVAMAVYAEACELSETPLWDQAGKVAHIEAFDFVAVVRFDTTQKLAAGVSQKSWIDDVPSDTIGVDAICDRVQLETPLPLSGNDDLPLTMLQGERLHPEATLTEFSDFAARVDAEGRFLRTRPGPVYISTTDIEDVNWRPTLLAAAAEAGEIDPKRWMIGLPGGLYLVPLKP